MVLIPMKMLAKKKNINMVVHMFHGDLLVYRSVFFWLKLQVPLFWGMNREWT